MNNTIHFDGKSTYIEVPTLGAPVKTDLAITVEFWNKADGGTNGFAFWFNTTNDLARVSCHAPWGQDKKLYWDCGSWQDLTKGRLAVDYSRYVGVWTHVALVAGSGERGRAMAIYINGEFVTGLKESTCPFPAGLTTGLVLGAKKVVGGADVETGSFHAGAIDEFRVWQTARVAADIKRDMYAQLVGDEENLVASYSFNWGLQGHRGPNYWERATTLPNTVEGGAAGSLKGFTDEWWIPGGVALAGPVAPYYDIRRPSTGEQLITATPRERDSLLSLAPEWSVRWPPFYAHRAPAPGTTPLYVLRNSTTGRRRFAVGPAARNAIDRRQLRKDRAIGAWTDCGEIGFVSASKNGDAIPLYEFVAADGTFTYSTGIPLGSPTPTVTCYVLPGADSRYQPKPVVFGATGLSEQIWYVVRCRSSSEVQGLRTDAAGSLSMAAMPATGDYPEFQWGLSGGRLVNRATGGALTLSAAPTAAALASDKPQVLALGNVAARGTDCFTLSVQGAFLSCRNGSVTTATTPGRDAEWTLLATELVDGYTLAGPSADQAALPYNKYLDAKGVPVIGTGTTSNWAMLRVKLVVENMLLAARDPEKLTKLKDKEVYVVSRDDSAAELARTPLGALHTEQEIARTRGVGVQAHESTYCYVSEEMMWKTGIFTKDDDRCTRKFDQVVHEFAHVLDNVLEFRSLPAFPDTTDNVEEFARKTQSWFASGGTWSDGKPLLAASTREEVRTGFPRQYAFLATCFDAANSWTPPTEFRTDPF